MDAQRVPNTAPAGKPGPRRCKNKGEFATSNSSAFDRLPTWQGIFPQTYFISLATLYLVLFASAFMSSSDLAYYSFPIKAPNPAMQLTQHFVVSF
jgi:hypothetical protein